jgi:hypothetical protein
MSFEGIWKGKVLALSDGGQLSERGKLSVGGKCKEKLI